jgi:hypothetical protein
MRVRMKHAISGTRDGREWPRPGEEIDLPDDEAMSLIRAHMAIQVEDAAKPETATAPRKAATRRKPKTD